MSTTSIGQKTQHFIDLCHPAKLLAVSKYVGVSEILDSYRAGQRDFAENRVQDLQEKAELMSQQELASDFSWHFIGPLQKNKINPLLKVPALKFIHSIDSLETLLRLSERMDHFQGDKLYFFIQINTSLEEQKKGVLPSPSDSLPADLTTMIDMFINQKLASKLEFRGLMTMGPTPQEGESRQSFQQRTSQCFFMLQQMRQKLQERYRLSLELSMGMSGDYQLALECGSDWLRLGSCIFK